MKCLAKITVFSPLLSSAKSFILIFDRVLNIPLDYLSCFAVVLRGIHGNVEMCQTEYSIPSKLIRKLFPLFWSHTWKYNIQVDERSTKVNRSLYNFTFFLMFLLFHFLHSNVSDKNECHKKKWRVLFFTRIQLVAHVPACVRVIARIKWIRLTFIGKRWLRYCNTTYYGKMPLIPSQNVQISRSSSSYWG